MSDATFDRRWLRTKALFDELLSLDRAQRSERLAVIETEDPDLRRELDSLLAADSGAADAFRLLEPGTVSTTSTLAFSQDTPATSARHEIGEVVSHYRIVDLIGAGGMGVVYRAEDTRLGRTVALKFVSAQLLSEPRARERLLREARAASALDHPNICTVYQVDETADGELFIAMAHYEGETLQQRLARVGPLPISDAVDFARQVASGLQHAHAAGVVHRDLKPANLVVTAGGVIKIVDFGLATEAESVADDERGGTIAYMSPEQLRGVATDANTDLWSLGVVLYELLTGRRPCDSDRRLSIMYATLHEAALPPSQLRAELTPAVDALVLKLLEKEPDLRYYSPGALAAALSSLVQARQSRWHTLPRIVRRQLIVGGVLLVAVSSAGGVRFWRWRADQALDPGQALILPFHVAAADSGISYLSQGMVDLLATRFTGVYGPRAVNPATAGGVLPRALKATADPISASRSRRLARTLHTGLSVTGSAVGNPAHASFEAVLTDVRSGVVKARAKVTGSVDSLAWVADQLVTQLLLRMAHESDMRFASLAATPLPAVQWYLAGRAAHAGGDHDKAIEHLNRALDIDSTFALAALHLAIASNLYGVTPGLQRGFRLASAGRARLSPGDAAFLNGLAGPIYPAPSPTVDKLRELERAAGELTDVPEVWSELSIHMLRRGAAVGLVNNRERAAEAARHALELDSSFGPALYNLAVLSGMFGDQRAAREYTRRYSAAGSTQLLTDYLRWRIERTEGRNPTVQINKMNDRCLQLIHWASQLEGLAPQDGDSALAEILRRMRGHFGQQTDGQVMQHDLALNFGRPGAAERAQDEMLQFAFPDSAMSVRVQAEKVRDALYWDGDAKRGAAIVAELERANKVPGPSSLRDARDFAIVEWRLWHNDTTGARDFITRLRHRPRGAPPPSASAVDIAAGIDALLAVVLRRPDAAQFIKRLEEPVRNGGDVRYFWNRILQLLYERQGDYAASLAAARRRLYWGRTMLISSSVLQEARMAALTGDREAAIRAYRHYIALNFAPEQSVKPRVDRARAELARLEAEHN